MNKLDVLHVHRHHVQSPLLPDTPLTPYICIQIRKWFGVTKFIKEPIFFPHFYRIHKNKNCLGILLACVVLPSFFRFLSFKSNSHRFVQHKWLFFTRVIINSMCASVCVHAADGCGFQKFSVAPTLCWCLSFGFVLTSLKAVIDLRFRTTTTTKIVMGYPCTSTSL